MRELSEFQQRACAAGLVKMLSGTHFSICDLDALAETMGCKASMSGPDYAALRAVHCKRHGSGTGADGAREVHRTARIAACSDRQRVPARARACGAAQKTQQTF